MKNISLYILVFILFLLIGFLYWDRYFISRKQITPLTKKVTNALNKNKIIPSPSVQRTPGYSVSIVKAPYLNGGFNFEVNVKNISISPFITKISFDHNPCKFSDSKGNEYKGLMYDGTGGALVSFPKALLPGESYTFEYNRVGVTLNGGGGMAGGIPEGGTNKPRCHYDSKGNNVCAPIEGLKFKECTATISTNNEGNSKFPFVINFPQ